MRAPVDLDPTRPLPRVRVPSPLNETQGLQAPDGGRSHCGQSICRRSQQAALDARRAQPELR
jgi:hypothetical protein